MGLNPKRIPFILFLLHSVGGAAEHCRPAGGPQRRQRIGDRPPHCVGGRHAAAIGSGLGNSPALQDWTRDTGLSLDCVGRAGAGPVGPSPSGPQQPGHCVPPWGAKQPVK